MLCLKNISHVHANANFLPKKTVFIIQQKSVHFSYDVRLKLFDLFFVGLHQDYTYGRANSPKFLLK